MKIRNGFVSNSSSSSFVIYGAKIPSKILNKENWDIILENKIAENALSLYIEGNTEDYFIGRYWSDIDDDETGLQFKEKVEREITKVIGKKLKCSTYHETFYN